MTEELEREAEQFAEKHAFRVPYDGSSKFYDDTDYKASKDGYLAGAEPKEQKIAKLEKQITKWREDYICLENLKDNQIKELEAQIEKMQCCENCKRYKPCVTCNETIGNNCDYYSGGNVCNNWQLN